MIDTYFKDSKEYLNWDAFYSQHKAKFFKDRQWLFTEFNELCYNMKNCLNDGNCLNIFEVGCGVGNTVFPLLKYHQYVFFYCKIEFINMLVRKLSVFLF